MKTYYYRAIIFSAILFFGVVLLSSTVNARNYNYDVLEKAKSLQFEGTFTVKRDGQAIDVHELKLGDEIVEFSNEDAYDPDFLPRECKQFVNIIVHEVARYRHLLSVHCAFHSLLAKEVQA